MKIRCWLLLYAIGAAFTFAVIFDRADVKAGGTQAVAMPMAVVWPIVVGASAAVWIVRSAKEVAAPSATSVKYVCIQPGTSFFEATDVTCTVKK